MDEKTLEMLEFHRVRETLAGFTSFPTSEEIALSLPCLTDHSRISHRLRQSAEASELARLEPGVIVGEIADTREEALMASRGKILDPAVLVASGVTLASVRRLHGNLARRSAEFPLLAEVATRLVPLKTLENRIAKCLSPEGKVLDSASPELEAVRGQLRNARRRLLDRLDAIIESPRGRRIIQESLVTEREGRYVIPVKAESRKNIRGIVHDVSNTGATIFIEPWTTVEAGNELRELSVEEQRQVERILRALSEEVGAHSTEIAANIEAAAEIDLAQAKARYARSIRGNEPTMVTLDDASAQLSAGLRLIEARHPLLGDKAVPLSVEIGQDLASGGYAVLIITGPNTGGKTVALKTIGLLSLMAQAGLPIPASKDTCLPVFDGIFVDIGDEQSIEQTLSTFSWHIGNITRIIDGATRRSLVLLDELGTSTDPAQGSALARAVLLHFLDVGSTTVATTHFSDLKAFAHAMPGMENASLTFDPVTTEPTYHLTVGLPGGSNTLETAARLGVPPAIVAKARSMLSEGTHQLEALLADLMTEKEKTEKLRHDLERQQEETGQRSAEIDRRLARLETEERTIIEEARDRVVREAAELHKHIRQATTQLRKEKSKEAIDRGQQQAAAARKQLASEGWQAKAAGNAAAAAGTGGEIATGDTVWLRDANVAGKVVGVSTDGHQVEVQAGATRIHLALKGVTRIDTPSGGKPPAAAQTRPPIPHGGKAARELLLLGKRADEAEWQLDSYLNSVFLSELDEVRIVHGEGTGALRKLVRGVLADHPLVKSYRPGGRGEGGNGVTVVQL